LLCAIVFSRPKSTRDSRGSWEGLRYRNCLARAVCYGRARVGMTLGWAAARLRKRLFLTSIVGNLAGICWRSRGVQRPCRNHLSSTRKRYKEAHLAFPVPRLAEKCCQSCACFACHGIPGPLGATLCARCIHRQHVLSRRFASDSSSLLQTQDSCIDVVAGF
jgi:hypothetical protein